MQYFGDSATALIARALEFAKTCGATQLQPEHLLLRASPDILEQTGLGPLQPQVERALQPAETLADLPAFAPQILTLFERAYHSSSGQVEEIHLLMNLDPNGLAARGEPPRFRDLLHSEALQILQSRDVNGLLLAATLADMNLLTVLPEPPFWSQPAGRQILDLTAGCSRPSQGSVAGFFCGRSARI